MSNVFSEVLQKSFTQCKGNVPYGLVCLLMAKIVYLLYFQHTFRHHELTYNNTHNIMTACVTFLQKLLLWVSC